MTDLEPILKYNMDSTEAKAYKIALLWEKTVQEELPGVQYTKLKRSGDPRKCTLFKYCYKLARETEGIIDPHHYKLYIVAQIQVLKNLKDSTGVHARIDCNCLVGDKAWKRWKFWKNKYQRQILVPQTSEDMDITTKESKVCADLDQTKEFLLKQFNQKYPSEEDLRRLVFDHTLIRWLTLGKISPYYAILSPLLCRSLDGKNFEEVFMFDLSLYKRSITAEIELYFQEKFAEEYGNNK